MIEENLPVPAAYQGLIIGQGGRNLNELQRRYDVRISMSDASATVSGPRANVTKCLAALGALVTKYSRLARAGRWRGKSPLVPRTGACPLCNTEIKGLDVALTHLQSEEHWQAVIKADPALAEVYEGFPPQLQLHHLAQLLSEVQVKRFHQDRGFQVEELLVAISWRLKAQEVQAEVDGISIDPGWLKIKSRVVVHWDDTCDETFPTHGLAEAPEMAEMLTRCSVGTWQPPVVTIPPCPAPLPQAVASEADARKAAHEYPAEPGASRFGLAVLEMLGEKVSDYDFICGTSFLRALAGDPMRIDRAYYIQCFQQTICVLSWLPRFDLNQVGCRVESLLCGQATGAFQAATTLTIDGQRFLVVSEVDAIDSEGKLVEIKSFKTNHGQVKIGSSSTVLQIALNGSEHLLACELSDCSMRGAEWFSTEEIRKHHMEDFSRDGQHVRYMLGKVSDFMKQHGQEIWKVTFDVANGKLPSFELAEGVDVLPAGLTSG